jgi:hypothetical protein
MQRSHCHFILILIGCLPMTSGCAVFMAVKGKDDPNLGVLGPGQDRAIAIATLGPPHETYFNDGNRVDVFKLKRGDKPSAGRAVAHGVLDFMTLGVWEVLGTPIEAMQGETFYLTVSYDHQERVVRVLPGDDGRPLVASQETVNHRAANITTPPSQSTGSIPRY